MSATIMYMRYALIFAAVFAYGKAFSQCSANFTHTPDQECAAIPVFFDASSSTGNGLTYTWDF